MIARLRRVRYLTIMLHRLALSLCLAPGLLVAPVAAHPHVFVEAQVSLVFDGPNMVGVRLTWAYDDFFSLLLTEDLGVDPDGDMVLTPAEEVLLRNAVLDWPADYGGDLHVTGPDGPLPLGDRRQADVRIEAGRIIESHLRLLARPVAPGRAGLDVQVYDPFYYVAYTVVGEIGLEGAAGCATRYTPADLDRAYALVDELLYGRPVQDVEAEEEFPMVGSAFADTVRVTCG